MNLKRIIGSHFANYREAWEANRLIDKGLIHPTLSKVYAMDDVGQAAYDVHHNAHQGKVGVLDPRPRGGPRRPRPGEAREAPRRDQPLPRRLSRPRAPAPGAGLDASRGTRHDWDAIAPDTLTSVLDRLRG